MVDFHQGECEFCGECARHCHSGALQRELINTDSPPWAHKALINENCLAFKGIVCRSCAEQCGPRAVVFRLSAGRVPQPDLDKSNCNGCGACFALCPMEAISFGV
jgi:ferredoxin-type protein NapF